MTADPAYLAQQLFPLHCTQVHAWRLGTHSNTQTGSRKGLVCGGGTSVWHLHSGGSGGSFTAVFPGLMMLLNNVKNLFSFDVSDVPNLPCLRLIKQLQYSQLRSYFKMHFQFQFVSNSLNYFSLFFLLGWVTSLRAVQTCFFVKMRGNWDKFLPKYSLKFIYPTCLLGQESKHK